MQSYSIILMYVVLFGALWFFMIRPQKKKQQELSKMRNELVVGDTIVTIGGVVGRVAVVKDDEIHMQVGHNQEVLVIKKWAIGSIQK